MHKCSSACSTEGSGVPEKSVSHPVFCVNAASIKLKTCLQPDFLLQGDSALSTFCDSMLLFCILTFVLSAVMFVHSVATKFTNIY